MGTERNKGGLKPWATPEQKLWLTSRIPSFLESRSSKTPSDFWARTFEDWFQAWPSESHEPAETDEQLEEALKHRKIVSAGHL